MERWGERTREPLFRLIFHFQLKHMSKIGLHFIIEPNILKFATTPIYDWRLRIADFHACRLWGHGAVFWLSGVSMDLPDDFMSYLRSDAPRCGELPDFPLRFEIWPEDQMEQWNLEYQVEECAPGFYGFASDGGGEMYAFGPDGAIYALPFIGMEPKVAKRLAGSWTELERKIIKKH